MARFAKFSEVMPLMAITAAALATGLALPVRRRDEGLFKSLVRHGDGIRVTTDKSRNPLKEKISRLITLRDQYQKLVNVNIVKFKTISRKHDILSRESLDEIDKHQGMGGSTLTVWRLLKNKDMSTEPFWRAKIRGLPHDSAL